MTMPKWKHGWQRKLILHQTMLRVYTVTQREAGTYDDGGMTEDAPFDGMGLVRIEKVYYSRRMAWLKRQVERCS